MGLNGRTVMVDPADLIYMPDEVAALGQEYLAQRRADVLSGKLVGVPLGIPSLDEHFLPLLPGQLCTILARPGHGKTSWAIRWARWWAGVIKQNPELYPNKCVIFVSTEQTVEELNSFMAAAGTEINIEDLARGRVSDEEWTRIEQWSLERSQLPLILIGQSQERRRKRIPLRMDLVVSAVQYIEDKQKLEPSLIVTDWLQQMKPAGDVVYRDDSRMLAVADNLGRCKDLAVMCGCPHIVTAQAGRQVDKKDIQIPDQEDGQWTSSLEQDSDVMFSVARPVKYKAQGEMFGAYEVKGENQLLVALLKQKMGKANILRMVNMDPRYNQINDNEERLVQLNPQLDPEEPRFRF